MGRTDRDLLKRFIDGHVESLGLLAARYEGDLYGFLVRFVGDRQAAEDLFQETFLQVWRKRHQYDPRRAVRPWLFTIAANLARDWLRREGRQRTLSLDNRPAGADCEGASFSDLLPADGETPLAALEREEQRQRVREAVDALPEHLRSVLVLAYYQHCKYREIAEILQIPVGTVKSRLHAAVAGILAHWRRSGSLLGDGPAGA